MTFSSDFQNRETMELEASSTASGEERGGTYPTRHSQRVKDIERTLYQLEQRARDLLREIQQASSTLVSTVKQCEQETEFERKRARKAEDSISSKKAKDPKKPKRPPTAFLLFCQENRDDVYQEFGLNTAPQQVLKVLGRRWKELTEVQTRPYHEKYRKLVEDFESKKRQYERNNRSRGHHHETEDAEDPLEALIGREETRNEGLDESVAAGEMSTFGPAIKRRKKRKTNRF